MNDKVSRRMAVAFITMMLVTVVANIAVMGILVAEPKVTEVYIEVPAKVDTKAQADSEIAAYNRGLEAGKLVGCDVSGIERQVKE